MLLRRRFSARDDFLSDGMVRLVLVNLRVYEHLDQCTRPVDDHSYTLQWTKRGIPGASTQPRSTIINSDELGSPEQASYA